MAALLRGVGTWLAGAAAGAVAAFALIRVNGSIVGVRDGAVVTAWLVALYGAAVLFAVAAAALLRRLVSNARRAPDDPTARAPFTSGLAHGLLFLALAGGGHGLLLEFGHSRMRAVAGGVALALALVAAFGRSFARRFAGGALLRAVALLVAIGFAVAAPLAARVASDPPLDPALPAVASAPRRVVLIGLDGADWRTLDGLLAKGRLPTFRRLLAEGVRAPLQTLLPTWSPRLWNTVSTGCRPEAHGVLDFTETALPGVARAVQRLRKEPLLPAHGGLHELVELLFRGRWLHEVPVTATQRRKPALWNLAGERGLRVAALNWYASWPAEPVNGYLVSDNNPSRATYLERKFGGGLAASAGFTYPESLLDELMQLDQHDPGEEREAIVEQPFFQDLSDEEKARWVATRGKFFAAFRTVQLTDQFVFASAAHLLQNDPLDLLALFVSGIDNLSHRSHRRIEIVERWYDYTDRLLGQLLQHADERTAVVIVSDHGWEYAEGPLLAHEHGPDGVFLAWGAGVARGVTLSERPRLEDIAPTVQALLGLPTAATQDGTPFLAALAPEVRAALPPPIASWGPYVAPALPDSSTRAAVSTLQQEGLEKLRELGYVK